MILNIHGYNSSGNNSKYKFLTEEYKKINPQGRLAALFANSNTGVKVTDSDAQTLAKLDPLSKDAFDNTFRILSTRIDKFGVAQPNINPEREKGIISVELPGINDKERVRKNLQSTANLQFWEVYNINEIGAGIDKADGIFNTLMGGKGNDTTAVAKDTTAKTTDTTATAAKKTDTGTVKLSEQKDTSKKASEAALAAKQEEDAKKHLYGYIQFFQPQQDPSTKKVYFPAAIGAVAIKDTALVRSYLDNPAIKAAFPSQLKWLYGIVERDDKGRKQSFVSLYAIKTFGRDKAKIEGDAVQDARQDYNNGKVEINMQMTPTGAKDWAKMTTENVGKPIAIVLDDLVYSAPNVNEPITGGTSSITGSYSVTEAQDLANMLKIGKLPAPAKIVSYQEVGPTLGAEAIRGGMMAFAISFVVIFLLMLVYYNTSGWIANIALILNLLFTVGVLAGFGASLTAPGIAGLVLTIGMAVDTNVIIYERIKEELARGKSYAQAVKDGYNRSLPPVLDGHVTTLVTAIILFYFGLGPVKGFATTQILGLILSLYCGILVSRWVTEIFAKRNFHVKYFTKLSENIFKHAQYKFVEWRKKAYVVSFIILGLGIASFFYGFDYGVEFDGGRSYNVRFDQNMSSKVENVREDLKAAFEGENPLIKTVGDGRTLDITTSYLIKDTRPTVDSIVLNHLYQGLKNYLPANLPLSAFDKSYKMGSKTVLPTISDDLKRGAVKATLFALLAIFVYIFIRFRDWRYSVGTIVALIHDSLVTLIVFSFARSFMPFPLEIDQHFIAAILTVIGFSMNDTVIIFDRIREDRKLHPSLTMHQVINKAINETLSRTIMTSVTVFLTILILFIFGGEIVRGFAFAMLIGVITGIYSSVFVAAPIILDLSTGKKDKKQVKA